METLRNKMLFRTTFLVLFYLLACNADTDANNGLGLDAENDANDDADLYNVVNNGMGIEVKTESTDDDADFFKSGSGLVSIPVQRVPGCIRYPTTLPSMSLTHPRLIPTYRSLLLNHRNQTPKAPKD